LILLVLQAVSTENKSLKLHARLKLPFAPSICALSSAPVIAAALSLYL